jgi:hypothetical protein
MTDRGESRVSRRGPGTRPPADAGERNDPESNQETAVKEVTGSGRRRLLACGNRTRRSGDRRSHLSGRRSRQPSDSERTARWRKLCDHARGAGLAPLELTTARPELAMLRRAPTGGSAVTGCKAPGFSTHAHRIAVRVRDERRPDREPTQPSAHVSKHFMCSLSEMLARRHRGPHRTSRAHWPLRTQHARLGGAIALR